MMWNQWEIKLSLGITIKCFAFWHVSPRKTYCLHRFIYHLILKYQFPASSLQNTRDGFPLLFLIWILLSYLPLSLFGEKNNMFPLQENQWRLWYNFWGTGKFCCSHKPLISSKFQRQSRWHLGILTTKESSIWMTWKESGCLIAFTDINSAHKAIHSGCRQ